ncbi:hypothetical protein DR999_PMT07197 [Platysternon megacephalum]|uniref:Uncharacterized protein n=1 Tax=Platysternon megacephalum TaxID=55544 RepID=A0A4D9ERN7_9SAUR|nr:hypothetical protein DR999_PMT07197 [Platysternon megacephalum]
MELSRPHCSVAFPFQTCTVQLSLLNRFYDQRILWPCNCEKPRILNSATNSGFHMYNCRLIYTHGSYIYVQIDSYILTDVEFSYTLDTAKGYEVLLNSKDVFVSIIWSSQ